MNRRWLASLFQAIIKSFITKRNSNLEVSESREQKKSSGIEQEEYYDEVKNSAATGISLESNIAYTTTKTWKDTENVSYE